MAKAKKKPKQKMIRIELTIRSAFLWSFFLLFLLFWVFVLGIFVGRGLLQGKISGIKNPFKIFQEMRQPQKKYEYEKPKEDPELIFYDKLLSKKNEAKNGGLPQKEVKRPDQRVTLSRDETAKPPERQEKTKIRKAIAHDTLQNGVTGDYFSVQIAALSDPEKAEILVKELVDHGYDAYYYTATVKGKITHRVLCGRFDSRDKAIKHVYELQKQTGYRGFVAKVESGND